MVKKTYARKSSYSNPDKIPFNPLGFFARFVLAGFLVLFVIGFTLLVPKKSSDVPAYRKKMGASIPELSYAQGTLYSHVLLPDGRSTFRIFDKKAHATDSAKLASLFPKPEERNAMIEWGKSIFESHRINYKLQHQIVNSSSAGTVLVTTETSQENAKKRLNELMTMEPDTNLCAHVAWRRLTATSWTNESTLRNLVSLTNQAISNKTEQKELLEWAETRRTQRRLERRFTLNDKNLVHVVRPTPPNLNWIRYWILWEEWGPTTEALAGRKKDLLDCFGVKPDSSGERALLKLGQKFVAERASNPKTKVPGSGERASLLAVFDRFSGLDPLYTPKAAEAANAHLTSHPHELIDVVPEVFARVNLGFIVNYDDWACVHDSHLHDLTKEHRLYQIQDIYQDNPSEKTTTYKPEGEGFLSMILWLFAISVVWMGYSFIVFVTADLPGFLLNLRKNPIYQKILHELEGRVILNVAVLAISGLITEMIASQFYDPLRMLLSSGGGGPSEGPFLQYTLAGLLGLGFDTLLKVFVSPTGKTPTPALAIVSFVFALLVALYFGVAVASAVVGAFVGVALSAVADKMPLGIRGMPALVWWLWIPVGILGIIIALNIAFAPAAQENQAANELVSGGKWNVKPAPKQPQWWQPNP